MKKFWVLTLLALGMANAADLTPREIWAKVGQTIDAAQDTESHILGKVFAKGKETVFDLTVQGIPALELTRISFAAPSALKDNVLILEGKKVWNYLSLPHQIVQTTEGKLTKLPGMPLDMSRISNLGKGLAQQDVFLSCAGKKVSRRVGLFY